jgi:glucan phosphoethanolaminetransferase (alkaline phosphatase superfamily)
MIISSSGGLSITLLLLILFIVIILLAVIWRVNLSGKIKWLATVVVLVVCVIVTGYFWSRKKGEELSGNFEGLALGKAYFWKVIVEDGKGGVSESETRRISIQ